MFAAQIGFFDTVIAAPSQAAALRAWGVKQNLFASGAASQTTDPEVIKAATASPGVPLRRAVGSKDRFTHDPTSLPHVPVLRKTKTVARRVATARPEADRSRLNAAEAGVTELRERRRAEAAEFHRQEQDLAARLRAADAAYESAMEQAERRLAIERDAFSKAGKAG